MKDGRGGGGRCAGRRVLGAPGREGAAADAGRGAGAGEEAAA